MLEVVVVVMGFYIRPSLGLLWGSNRRLLRDQHWGTCSDGYKIGLGKISPFLLSLSLPYVVFVFPSCRLLAVVLFSIMFLGSPG